MKDDDVARLADWIIGAGLTGADEVGTLERALPAGRWHWYAHRASNGYRRHAPPHP